MSCQVAPGMIRNGAATEPSPASTPVKEVPKVPIRVGIVLVRDRLTAGGGVMPPQRVPRSHAPHTNRRRSRRYPNPRKRVQLARTPR